MLYLSCYCSYPLVYYKSSTSYWVEPKAKGSIKLTQPFLRARQSAIFGTHFHDHGQYSTYTCINTWLTIILIPLCYGESSMRISSWYIPHSSYMILRTHIFKHKISSIGVVSCLFYFLCIPLHGLALYSLSYPLCLFPSHLNHAFVYFNQICAPI